MPHIHLSFRPTVGTCRRLFISTLVVLFCLLGVSIQANAETVTQPDASLGTQWPKFDGVYLRLKDGGLIELPTLEPYTWNKDVDAYSRFQRIDGSTGGLRKLLIDPEAAKNIPVVDGTQIEAIVVVGQSHFDRLATIHRLSDYLNDPSGSKWSPNGSNERPIGKNWQSLLMLSNWGMDDNAFKVERGPNGGKAYHFGSPDLDITKWRNGRWMPNGWKQGDPQDVPIRVFVVEFDRRHKHRLFRITQQPLN